MWVKPQHNATATIRIMATTAKWPDLIARPVLVRATPVDVPMSALQIGPCQPSATNVFPNFFFPNFRPNLYATGLRHERA
jgi:hypothetical protein